METLLAVHKGIETRSARQLLSLALHRIQPIADWNLIVGTAEHFGAFTTATSPEYPRFLSDDDRPLWNNGKVRVTYCPGKIDPDHVLLIYNAPNQTAVPPPRA